MAKVPSPTAAADAEALPVPESRWFAAETSILYNGAEYRPLDALCLTEGEFGPLSQAGAIAGVWTDGERDETA